MAEGRSNQAICDRLFLAPKTVEAHIANIFSKLELLPAPDDHRECWRSWHTFKGLAGRPPEIAGPVPCDANARVESHRGAVDRRLRHRSDKVAPTDHP